MKKIYLIMTLICMMVSCKPDGGDGKHQGHEYVDLGLSVKWATCNIGAISPEEFGQYFAWHEISPKNKYTDDDRTTCCKQMNAISSNPQYDAATANWGGDWRIPTMAELNELIYNCTWIWTVRIDANGYGVNGYKIEGPNGNSIFLPAAGYLYGSSYYDVGYKGDYWSSMLYEDKPFLAYCLHFNSGDYCMSSFSSFSCLSVRPVLE